MNPSDCANLGRASADGGQRSDASQLLSRPSDVADRRLDLDPPLTERRNQAADLLTSQNVESNYVSPGRPRGGARRDHSSRSPWPVVVLDHCFTR